MRRWLRRLGIALLVLLGLTLLVYGLLFVPQLYFRTALFIVERSALNRDRVDWAAVRRDAQLRMRGARSTRDTYPAIRLVLERLGDHHSHLTPPERVRELRAGSNLGLGLTVLWPERQVALVLPESPAARAGITAGDRLESVDGGPVEHVPGHPRAHTPDRSEGAPEAPPPQPLPQAQGLPGGQPDLTRTA